MTSNLQRRLLGAVLLCAAAGSALAADFVVAPNGKSAKRPSFNYVAPAPARVGATVTQTPVGAACDCSITLTSGGSTLCAVAGSKPTRVAACVPAPVVVAPPPPPPPPPTAWTKIADENGMATLKEPQFVRFGAGVAWTEKVQPAGMLMCGYAAFGVDPAPNVFKECDLKSGPAAVIPPPPPPPALVIPVGPMVEPLAAPAPGTIVWQEIADERRGFRVTLPDTVVRFGADSRWTEATFQPGSFVCGAGLGDPAFGSYKTCQMKVLGPKYVWKKAADDGAIFSIREPQVVRYGRFQDWTEELWPAGTVFCQNGTFPDPLPGATKTCELRSGPAVTIPAAAHAMTDHSGQGPAIDMAQAFQKPDPSTFSTEDRLINLWLDPATGLPIGPLQAVPSDLGGFRLGQAYAGTAKDDPMVLPGQPGKSHTHTFFGLLPGAFFSDADMEACPGSYNAGGKLLCTITWIPSIVDTRTGMVIWISSNLLYYKRSYLIFGANPLDVVPIPQNLKFVAGNATNTDPDATWGSFICMGPGGENPGWKRSFKAAAADGTCVPGGEFIFSINAPYCWDGRLDSPNHKDHLTFPVQDGLGDPNVDRGYHCPASHPKQIPAIGGNYHHAIQPGDDVSAWQFSCDMGGPDSGGACAHMDYWAGPKKAHRTDLWQLDKNVYEMWTDLCLRRLLDCHANLLGDNLHMLY